MPSLYIISASHNSLLAILMFATTYLYANVVAYAFRNSSENRGEAAQQTETRQSLQICAVTTYCEWIYKINHDCWWLHIIIIVVTVTSTTQLAARQQRVPTTGTAVTVCTWIHNKQHKTGTKENYYKI
jgi:hypothetical protein